MRTPRYAKNEATTSVAECSASESRLTEPVSSAATNFTPVAVRL